MDELTLPIHGRSGIRAVTLVDATEDWALAYRWFLSGPRKGPHYVVRFENKRCIYLAREIMDAVKGIVVDHINGDPLDNRRSNLRLITQGENVMNQHTTYGKSKYRGVCWHKRWNLWQAQVTIRGEKHYLGYFKDEDEAGRVAAEFRREHMPLSTT
jgi:hypothetical protein